MGNGPTEKELLEILPDLVSNIRMDGLADFSPRVSEIGKRMTARNSRPVLVS